MNTHLLTVSSPPRARHALSLTSALAFALVVSSGCDKPAGDTPAPSGDKAPAASGPAAAPLKPDPSLPGATADPPANTRVADAPVVDAPAAEAPTQVAAPAEGDPEVELLAAGAEPLSKLRFAVKPKEKQSMEMRMKMNMRMKMDGMGLPAVDLPVILMVMGVEVIEVKGDLITYTFSVDKAEPLPNEAVAKQVADAVRESLQGTVGLSGTATVTDRGLNRGLELKTPAGMPQQAQQLIDGMRDSLSQVAAPVPEEAIGVGARWRVKQALTQNGITLNQTATYELVKRDGATVTLKVGIEQGAVPQEMKTEGLPKGTRVQLNALTGGGEGVTTLNTHSILPVKAEMDVQNSLNITVNAPGSTQKMSTETKIRVDMESKKGG